MSSKTTFHFHCISLFPSMFDALKSGVIGRGLEQGLIHITHHNPRHYSDKPHGYVDDRPYGGGPGMVMAAPPLQNTIDAIRIEAPNAPVIYFSPHGQPLHQTHIHYHRDKHHEVILLCGRYEGVDQRLIERSVDHHYALGECVLSGGEIPAMYFIDALSRWIPGVLQNPDSLEQESFNQPLLDHAHYTRPQNWDGIEVPSVLCEGDHQAIEAWRHENAKILTQRRQKPPTNEK